LTWPVFNRMVKVKFTLFALPFTVAGAILPFVDQERFVGELPWTLWLWIAVAFLTARTAGMTFNELIDRRIDAQNPRTAMRVLPQGEASPRQAGVVAWLSVALFLIACLMINIVVFCCAPVVAFLLFLYSYTKRFTSLCHFVLGAIQFFGPVLAWTAVTGSLAWPPCLLGVAVWTSITANDIVYAVQDYRFDMGHGLHSIPVAMGPSRAIRLSRWLHLGTILSLISLGITLDLSFIYFVGIAILAGLLRYHHKMVQMSSIHSIPRAFFTCNSLVGLITLLSILGALLCPALF